MNASLRCLSVRLDHFDMSPLANVLRRFPSSLKLRLTSVAVDVQCSDTHQKYMYMACIAPCVRNHPPIDTAICLSPFSERHFPAREYRVCDIAVVRADARLSYKVQNPVSMECIRPAQGHILSYEPEGHLVIVVCSNPIVRAPCIARMHAHFAYDERPYDEMCL